MNQEKLNAILEQLQNMEVVEAYCCTKHTKNPKSPHAASATGC